MLRVALILILLHAQVWAVGLRVVTYNIETNRNEQGWPNFALGDVGGVDFDSVAAILGRIDADVVALQEVHTSDINGGDLANLGAALGLPYIHAGSNTGNFDTSLRVVMLSRYPFLSADSIFSPAGAKEIARHGPAVLVDVPGTTADPLLISCHLKSGTGSDDRLRRAIEMRRLVEYLDGSGVLASDNFIILGDFNPSGTNKVFDSLPSGLPSTYSLGTDVSFPVSYSTDMVSYFSGLIPTRLDPRQLNGNDGTYEFGQTLDLLLVSPGLAGRPYATEIYNSALDVSNAEGLSKAGSPLASTTSAEASDHYAVFADFELDQALFNLGLAVSAPSVAEADPTGTVSLTVSLAGAATTPVTISLASDDSLTVPEDVEVVIPVGASSATTAISTGRNFLAESSRLVTFSAMAQGYASASAAVEVTDSDSGYQFNQPGEVLAESFDGFTGLFVPAPWESTASPWLGLDDGSLAASGGRGYGDGLDGSVGWLSDGSAMVLETSISNEALVPLETMDIRYDAEQWLSRFEGAGGTIEVELELDGTVLPMEDLTFSASTSLPEGAVAGGNPVSRSTRVSGLGLAPGASMILRFRIAAEPGSAPLPADVFINEFHYDNTSTDEGEFVEVVVGPGFTGDLDDVELLLYTGNSGELYGAGHSLDDFVEGPQTASGHRVFSKLISGIQNGSPDGLALTVDGVVAELISYEGEFTATEGPANGMVSVDVDVQQSSSGAVGKNAIGRTGVGAVGSDFDWIRFDGLDHSPGNSNDGQTFELSGPPAQGLGVDSLELTFVEDSDLDGIPDDEDLDDDNDGQSDEYEMAFGSDPLDEGSRFEVSYLVSGSSRLIEFPGASGVIYVIEWCDDLVGWETLSSHEGEGATVSVVLPDEETRAFFRIKAGE